MGISGLWDYFKKLDKQTVAGHGDPNDIILKPIEDFEEEFKGKTLGMDSAIFMYMVVNRSENPAVFYIDLYHRLERAGIKLEFYFDGKTSPLKVYERARRQRAREMAAALNAKREEMIETVDGLINGDRSLDEFMETVDDRDPALAKELKKSTKLSIDMTQFGMETAPTLDVDLESVRANIASKIDSYNGRVTVSKEDYRKLMLAFDDAKIPYLIAKTEAEKLGAQRVRDGYVDAIITNDGDITTFGCPLMIRNLCRNDLTPQKVELTTVLRRMDITHSQYIDVCIMSGCDFTESSGMPGIGISKALVLVKRHGSLKAYMETAQYRGWLKKIQSSGRYTSYTPEQFQHDAAREMFLDLSDQSIHMTVTELYGPKKRSLSEMSEEPSEEPPAKKQAIADPDWEVEAVKGDAIGSICTIAIENLPDRANCSLRFD